MLEAPKSPSKPPEAYVHPFAWERPPEPLSEDARAWCSVEGCPWAWEGQWSHVEGHVHWMETEHTWMLLPHSSEVPENKS